jgi:endo-1,4-beta-D-glucanase Y
MLANEYMQWKTAHVVECTADNSAIVSNGGSVVSEGIGYGMLLAAGNGDRTLFDELYKFYTDHLDAQGLMNWSLDTCAAPGNNNANAATDADLDTAMALVQANAVWGGYASQAATLIGAIRQHEVDTTGCPGGIYALKPGDAWGGCNDPNNPGKIDPSYFAPGYYRVFATIDTANAAVWQKLADDSYTLLADYQTQMAGLVPDWAKADGTLYSGTGYGYDACRTPWRVAVDYSWFCTDAAQTFLANVNQYVTMQGGVAKVPFDKNSAFLGSFALSGMAVDQTTLDNDVTSWLGGLGSPSVDTPYYQGTLRVLYPTMGR